MTDEDICGVTCGDGSPCQNRAGDNGFCWIPSHNPEGDDENPDGRPELLDEYREDVIDAARRGKSIAGCGREAGVDESTIRGWIERHEEFSRAFRRSRAEGEDEWIDEGRGDDGDPSFAKFMLSSSYGYQKSEKREVDLDADVDASHDVTADFVTFSSEDDVDD
jgi:transposase-like protein